MKTLASENINLRITPEIQVAARRRGSASVDTWAMIRADQRRVLYAITIPEYMEAWLQIPEVSSIRVIAEPENPCQLQLELFGHGDTFGYISVTVSHITDCSVTMIWGEMPGRASSVVHFSLRGSDGCCMLRVRHKGLADQAAEERYGKIWQQSLMNLGRLLGR